MPVTDLTISAPTDVLTDDLREETPVGSSESAAEVATRPATKPTKVGFVSLGCPKNLVDSEVMMGLLARAGAELTTRAEDADVIVVNTCSFIESAQQESVNTILEMAGHKTGGRAKKLVVAGCLVERFRDQIRKDIPEVDAVVGTGELEKIMAATGVAPAPNFAQNNAGTDSPFVVLQSRRKVTPARRRDDSRARRGMEPSATCRTIFTMTPRLASWPRRGTWLTSRLRKAATTPAVSASFRSSADNSARGVLRRWWPRLNAWRSRACARSR